MAFFGPKPWVNHFGKTSLFSDFLDFLFLQPRKAFFPSKKYFKRHFPGLYFLKKKFGKTANFVPKLLVNPFRKMSIFRLFKIFVFLAQKGDFLFQNIVKHIFRPLLSKTRKLDKGAFFEQNYGLTPLEKSLLLDFLNLLFLQRRKAFFRFRIW